MSLRRRRLPRALEQGRTAISMALAMARRRPEAATRARRAAMSPPLVLLLLGLLGLCASLAAAVPFQCAPKPHVTTPELGTNNLCQCGRESLAVVVPLWIACLPPQHKPIHPPTYPPPPSTSTPPQPPKQPAGSAPPARSARRTRRAGSCSRTRTGSAAAPPSRPSASRSGGARSRARTWRI